MKKLLSLLLVVLAGAGLGLGGWRLVTALPEGYAPSDPPADLLRGRALAERLGEGLADALGGGRTGTWPFDGNRGERTIELDADDLQNLLVARLAADRRGRQLLRHARRVRVEIDRGEIEAGVVLRLADLPPELTAGGGWAALDRLTPALAERPVYYAARATPEVRDGRLYVGRAARIKIGRLSLSPGLVAGLVDVEEEGLDEGWEVDLRGARIERLEVLERTVRLTLGPRS